jgi:hypothetical protein
MKRVSYAFLPVIFCFLFCSSGGAIAQSLAMDTAIETGFVVITPLDGDGEGLSVSEVFGQEVRGVLFRSSVLPSPLVTSTSVFTRSDPNAAIDTGIAIVNPNAATARVVLTLNNEQGITIASRTITVGPRQQISRFVIELFFGTPELFNPFAGLLFITSDFPVGVLGLAFTGPSFTSLPVATQLNPNITVTGGIGTGTTSTFVIRGQPTQTFNVPTNAGSIPPVQPIPPVPPTITTPIPNTITQVPNTITQVPATFSSLPPLVPTTGTFVPLITTPPVSSSTPANGFILVRGDVFFAIPSMAAGVGGIAAQLLPQIATGGGWESTIAIANTSAVDRLVRADFFNSDGGPLRLPFGSSVTGILVPAGGVVTLSTN